MSGWKRALVLCIGLTGLLTRTEPVRGQQRIIGGAVYGPGVVVFPPGYVGTVWQVPYGSGAYGCVPGLTGYPYLAGGVSFRQAALVSVRGVTVASAQASFTAGTFYSGPAVSGCAGIFLPTDVESVVYGSPVPRLPRVSSGGEAAPFSVRSANDERPAFDGSFVLPEQLRGPLQPAAALRWPAVRRAVRDRAVRDEFPPVSVPAGGDLEAVPEAAVRETAIRAADAVVSGRLERARTLLQAVLSVRPDRPDLRVQTAGIQILQRDFEAAAISLKTVLASGCPTAAGQNIPIAVIALPDEVERETIDRSLWKWLHQQPGSVDRLLVAALWEKWCGRLPAATELLELAEVAGLSSDDRNRMAALPVRTVVMAADAAEDSALARHEQVSQTP